jgi:hypothetical protein
MFEKELLVDVDDYVDDLRFKNEMEARINLVIRY